MKKLMILLLPVLLAGCHWGGRKAGDDESRIHYEIAWVEPEMVLSDSICTLIRAARIDSFPSDNHPLELAPSIIFEVAEPGCPVTVTLYDIYGAAIRPLLVRELPPGFYHLTVSPTLRSTRPIPPGPYLLKSESCGRISQSRVYLD